MEPSFLCIFVLKITSGAQCKDLSTAKVLSPPEIYATNRSKAVVLVIFLFCVVLWVFLLLRDISYRVLPCSLFSCVFFFFFVFVFFSVLFLAWGRKGWSIWFSCICLFILPVLFSVFFLFLLMSGVDCGLWLWHSSDFSVIIFTVFNKIIEKEANFMHINAYPRFLLFLSYCFVQTWWHICTEIYLHFIAIALDETSILVAVYFSVQNIYQSCDLGRALRPF